LTLGYFFAGMAMWLPIKRYTVVAVYVPLLALLVPLLESGVSVIRRLLRGTKPTTADRGHIHFRLLGRGLSENAVRGVFFSLAGIGVLFSLAVAYGNRRLWLLIFGFFMLLLSICFYILLRSPVKRGDGRE
jgi:UDP-GlcNAc:undecaprenyl-phosphate GlcNAc-1-phosphate transferase